jgi:HAMP domain-containing protein
MTLFHFSGIRFRLTILVLSALLPGAGLIVYTGWEQPRHDAHMALQELTYLVRSAGATYRLCFERTLDRLSLISKISRGYGDFDYNAFLSAMLQEHSQDYAGLIIVNPKGDLLGSASAVSRPVNFADRDWYRLVVQTRKPAISDVLVGRVTGEQGVVVAFPALNASGQIEFIVAANVGLTQLGQMLREIDLPKALTTTLLDRKGVILAASAEAKKWIGMNIGETPIGRAILGQKNEATVEMAGEDGIRRLYAFTPVQVEGEIWAYLRMGISPDIAFAATERNLIRNLLWLGLVASLAVAAAWWIGSFYIVRPVSQLLTKTKRLAAGDLNTPAERAHYGRGELDQLAHAFDRMADSLRFQEAERKRAEEARRKTEEHFRKAIENIFRFVPEALLVFTDRGSLFKTNKAFHDLVRDYSVKLNYPEEELAEAILKEVKKRIADGDPTEIRISKKEG